MFGKMFVNGEYVGNARIEQPQQIIVIGCVICGPVGANRCEHVAGGAREAAYKYARAHPAGVPLTAGEYPPRAVDPAVVQRLANQAAEERAATKSLPPWEVPALVSERAAAKRVR